MLFRSALSAQAHRLPALAAQAQLPKHSAFHSRVGLRGVLFVLHDSYDAQLVDGKPVLSVVVFPVLVATHDGHRHVYDILAVPGAKERPAQLRDLCAPVWAQAADKRLPAVPRPNVVVPPLEMSCWSTSKAARGLSAPVVS